ncbi:MAG: phosphatase PAP2 family protein [Lachnospiraceae bacterium]|nr:phosphatase PAP2 family protein [Lachnospiraceae bacterium]
MLQKFKTLFCAYGHLLIPILYAPFYIITFIWLENRPVSQITIIEMEIDKYIPFCEYFIIPYYLWFGYIALTVLTFAFLPDRKDYYRLCLMLGVGMTIFLFVSYIWPNGLQLRPAQLPRDNFCTDLVRFLQKSDTSTNVFPSIHCYNSMVANAAIWKNEILSKKKGIKWASLILSTSVLLSTLFLKQHSLMDLLGAAVMFILFYIPLYLIPQWQQQKHAKKIVSGKLS